MWLNSDRDWKKTEMEIERINQAKNRSSKGWTAVQGKVLRERYASDPKKFDALVAKRQSQGLFYKDEDFPEDVDEL